MRKQISLVFISVIILILLSSDATGKNLVNEEVSVSPLSFNSYCLVMEEDNVIIKLSIDVYFGDITVGVLNAANYALWVDGNEVPAYFARNDLVEGDYEVELGPAGFYYIVLDNSDSLLFSAQLKIVVSIPTIGETIGIAVAVVVVGGIIILAIVNSNKRKRTQQPLAQQAIQTPYVTIPVEQPIIKAIKYCKNCGSQLETDSNFCTNCGMKQ